MISDEARERMDEIISRYPVKRSAILPLLHVAQSQDGYLTEEGIRLVADKLGLSYHDVSDLASFYTMFYRQPMGRYHIQWCRSISCMLRGSDDLRKYVEAKLGIGKGETTPDKRFSLSEVECIGACDKAPAMQINFDYHENLSRKRIDEILGSLM